jgi:hypothetical protein
MTRKTSENLDLNIYEGWVRNPLTDPYIQNPEEWYPPVSEQIVKEVGDLSTVDALTIENILRIKNLLTNDLASGDKTYILNALGFLTDNVTKMKS